MIFSRIGLQVEDTSKENLEVMEFILEQTRKALTKQEKCKH